MTEPCTIEKIKEVLSDLQSQLDNKIPPQKDTVVGKKQQQIQKPVEDKGPSSSLFGRVRGSVKKVFKGKKETLNQASDSGGSRRGRPSGQDQENANLEILKLQNDIRQMKTAFEKLTDFQSNINKSLETEVPSNKLKAILSKMESVKSSARDLKEIRRKVLNLKGQIPSLLKKQSSIGLNIKNSQTAEETGQIVETGSDISLPGLHVSDDFKESLAFEEVKEKFEALEFTKKLCLLSLAVFPENKEVQRTMLMYWWIGENFISDRDSENTVTEILDEFSRERLLEPVEDERKLKPSGYKMVPHVHSAVIRLASHVELYVLHDSEGKLVMTKSGKGNICLVRGSSLQQEAKKVHLVRSTSLQQEAKTSGTKQIALKSVFNSSERYPDFTFKWFPKTVSLEVLYLGRWERTATRHIEVESTEFLKDIKLLKKLRLASFQGISRIENLKDLSCTLPHLVILDLRACYNLEALPDDIGSLESLIYLDVSECYMLDRMPKEIADLKKLQVLKGFVISQSNDENNCTVKHLENLENLRKLSITVNREDFKVEEFMESMKGLQRLESLKIAWGAPFPIKEPTRNKETTNEERQGGHATEEQHTDPKEGEDDQVHKKGQTSEEKSEDGNEKATPEEGKKRDEVKAESSKSDEVVEGEKKTSPSRESTEKEKPDDGDKGKADQEEGKKRDEVKSESLKSEKKASPSGGETGTIQNKPGDEEGKSKVAGDGDKGKAATEEGKKQDEVDAEKSRSENGAEGVKKASPSSESTNTIENKQKGDKQEEKGDGEKEKVNLEEGKKKDEVKAVSSKPDKVIEGDEKTRPPQESKDTVKSKPDDHQRGDKQEEKRDGEKDKTEEGKKKDEVKAVSSQPDKILEGDKETSPPQESQDTVKSKPDDQRGDKQEEKRDGEKDKTEEGKKKDEVKAVSSQPDKVLEGDKETSPPQESQDTVKSKPDDHQRGDKQEEKRDGEKDKTEEGKKKDEVKAESSKPDKVIEGDKKKSLAQQFNDTIQSKQDDHKENSKVQEKEDGEKIKAALKKPDGGEVKTQKLDKKKLGKNVGFSEEPVQKKPDDAMEKDNHERSIKTATKESGLRFTRKFTKWRNETKKPGKGGQEDSGIDASKQLPSSLKKLELECYPKKEPPIWLNPKTLDNLKKLSIKGGSLSSFSDESSTAENKCAVQILRLKYLHEFKAEWKDLHALFPNLELLEKYKCPEVAFCPTDGNGVWRLQP